MKTRLTAPILLVLLLLAGCGPGPASTPAINTPTQTAPTRSPAASTPTITSQTLAGWLDEFIAYATEAGASGEFSGAVLFASGEEILWESAYGLADRSQGLPNRVDTRFNLASMNKMFTAVAILQLMEVGRLRLEDTILHHLPDYPNSAVAEKVTIRQLLTHTSGLGDVFTEQYDLDPHRHRSNADFLPLFVDEPLLFKPGEAFSYSNAGFVVLGLIIEAVSGLGYDEYVQENIFDPAGMAHTGAFDVDASVPNLALGYTTETGTLTTNEEFLPGRGFAAGGGYSTTRDLFRFRNALLQYELLGEGTTLEALAGKVEMGPITDYGYGFMDRDLSGQRVGGHTGGFPGICSFLYMYIESGHTVVVLSNSDDGCVLFLEYLGDHSLQGVE